jgi:hypothetical protein
LAIPKATRNYNSKKPATLPATLPEQKVFKKFNENEIELEFF